MATSQDIQPSLSFSVRFDAALKQIIQYMAVRSGPLVAGAGILVLIGWALDIQALTSIHPGWASMKANTALGFVFAGLSLYLLHRPAAGGRGVLMGRACALAAALIGAATLAEYVFGLDLHIDHIL